MLQEIILSVIISIDTFLAASAYGCSRIEIPFFSAFIISAIGAFFLGISLLFSTLISVFIPENIWNLIGFMILLTIGIITIFKSFIRCLIRRLSESGELSLHTGGSGIVVKLYLDDTAADIDNSKVLSPKEAAALAVAASLDSLSIGISMGGDEIKPVTAAIFTFIAGFAAIITGSAIGRKIASMNRDFSWIGGVALIIFAVSEFVK